MGLDIQITRTASEIAEICGATLEGDGSIELVGAASLREAAPNQVSFLRSPLYRADLEATRAGAVVLGPGVEPRRRDLVVLRCDEPNAAFSRVVQAFLPPSEAPPRGVHQSAFVDPDARLGADVGVGPKAVIGASAAVGDGAVIHAGAVVGPGATVGPGTVVHAGAVLYAGVRVGARCIIHSGAVIGSDGFGFDPGPDGWTKVPQCGTVVVEDDVEIGANSTIDRARFGVTRIGRGAKLDNLVQVAHNCDVGPGVLLVAQVGLSGSTRLGAGAILGGKVGTNGHIEIGAGSRVGGASQVMRSLPPGGDFWGFPARPKGEALRVLAITQRLPELHQTVRELERRLRALEEAGR